MQAHEGIKDEEPRLQSGDGLIETYAVDLEIKAQAGRGDHLDVELDEVDARGDGDGQIEGQEGFAAFWLAADDPDGLFRPQSIDEPTLLLGAVGEAPGRLDRKQGHRRRRVAALVSLAAGTAQVSKNSVSSIWRASRCAASSSNSPAMIIRARRLPWA